MEEKITYVQGGYQIAVCGSGGGKKKTPSVSASSQSASGTEVANNLRSRDDAVVLLLLGEGEIAGSASGDLLKDVYLDETPIKNSDGTLNFQNVIVEYRGGTQFQDYISGIASDIETEKSVSVQVKVVSGAVTRRITNPNANAVRLRMLVPSLLFQDEKSGNIFGSEVEFSIQISTQGGAFTEVAREKIAGKTTSSYERSYRQNLSTNGPWDVRIIRITPDAPNTRIQNDLYWQSFVEIVDTKLRYPNSALLGIRVSAEQFQSIPRISVKLKQLIIAVPHNYDAEAKIYNGLFNGTLIRRYSNNPAWIFYDILTNSRYGCGRFVDTSQVDIFALYSIGQYCDEKVSDGNGRLEPRFSCNCYIQSADDAFKILEAIASCFRGMMYQSGDSITAIQDKPIQPTRAYTEANVVCEYDDTGLLTSPPFNYSGTSLETRFSVALVSWSDPEDFYQIKVETVEDRNAILKYGYNQTEITAFGCTSRSQAHRLGRWTLLSQQLLTQTVNFSVGAEGLLVRPGEIFKIIDKLKTVNRLGGRIVSAALDTVAIDSSVTILSGKNYEVSIVKSDGKIESRPVTSPPGNHDFLTVFPFFSEIPRHVWVLEFNDIKAQLFRCISVNEVDSHKYEIIGIEYNASIYDAVEKSILFESLPVSGFPNFLTIPQSPGAIVVTESLYQTIGSGGVKVQIGLTWQGSSSPFIRDYQVEYKRIPDVDFKIVEITQNLNATIYDANPGIYFFRVKAINNYGVSSGYAFAQREITGLLAAPSDVMNFTVTPFDKLAVLSWELVPDLDVRVGGYYKIKHTPKKTKFTWADGIELAQVSGSGTTVQVQLLDGSYMIKAIDSQGNQSNSAAQITLENVPNLFAFNAIASSIQHPNYTGLKTNTTVIGGILRLTSLDYFDAQPGFFDDSPGLFDNVGGYFDSFPGLFDDAFGMFDDAIDFLGVVRRGEYEFDHPVDLGSVYTNRITATLTVYNINETKLFDRTSGFFDDAAGLFDGEDNDSGSALLQIATSQNGINFTSYKTFVVGDYTARAFKFKLLLENGETNHNVYVESLSVSIDAPDRVFSGNFFTSIDSNTIFNFDYSYAATPEVALTIQNGVAGDYIELISKSPEGIVVNAKNSTGFRIVRYVSCIAKGYGRKNN